MEATNTSNFYSERIIKSVVLFIILFLASCNVGDHSPAGLVSYMQEHKTQLESVYSGKELSSRLTFTPPDMAAFRDYRLSEKSGDFQDFKQEYSHELEFTLVLSDNSQNGSILKRVNTDDNKEFMNTYYSYQIGNDIKMVTGSDTLHCKYVNAIQAGGVKDELLFTLAFDKPVSLKSNTIKIIFFERLFGNDIHEFVCDYNAFEKAPSILQF